MKTRGHTTRVVAEPTLGDHLRELQWRFLSTAIVFVIVAAAAYPFFSKIKDWLLAPLQGNQELVYLTPGGAFGFIITVCLYVGLIGTLPLLIYHIYGFVMPAVQTSRMRAILAYTIASLLLALGGVLFAYYIILPAALYFLTGFELGDINPMLTIDSYISFVMTYMLAGALLFQVPLVMMIINSVKPLPPRKLMKYQRHIILGSFILAAIISPTPDALNQALLASPLIVMYQVGIIIVWRLNARAKKRADKALLAEQAASYKKRLAERKVAAPHRAAPRLPEIAPPKKAAVPVTAAPIQPVASSQIPQTAKKPAMDIVPATSRPMRMRPAPARAPMPDVKLVHATVSSADRRSMDIMQQRQTMLAHAQADRASAALARSAPALTDSMSRARPVVPVRGTIDGMVRA